MPETTQSTTPNHSLIEGDNLHALTVLNYTHAGTIDVIYIDPPYNTGNKDFKYNDRFIDREDGYRHSKWLSFMEKRLRLAKNLLKDSGVIFISIDDNEQAQLKLLCDEIFGEENFVANVSVINNLKGRSDEKYIATAHESLLIYKKTNFETLGLPAPEDYIEEYKLTDALGKYRLLGLRKRGDNSLREDRPNLFYPIYYNISTNQWSLDKENFRDPIEIIPKLSDGSEGNWRWGKDTLLKRKDEIVIQKVKKRNEYDVFQKDYLHKSNDELKRVKPKSFWTGTEFSSDAGTKSLKEVISDVNFRSPKPIGLIKCCLSQASQKSAKVLDFFAGSGTTLHAVMALNAEDGGSRECILVTNNENNICEEVTYERNKRVIQGYPNAKGEPVAGLSGNNLRYYQTGYVGREKTLANKRALMALATEMLCLKEGVYEEENLQGMGEITGLGVRVFQENSKAFMVVYDEEAIDQAVEIIQSALSSFEKIKVYVFATGSYPYTDDFEEVLDRIELCALPDAIYRAYQRLLPKEDKNTIV
ncbi:site-specific DNA-methyltransferase [Runella rosea]|uniref:site-specific DNA-methyltransferase (adenine-specific) n=1 Tax=Runella rosea TaxID=2259595 RepID=A0A344TQG4_9BACT|nr:site-specific DNA-methyltransferase [Runella rosea]AXE20885.1 site-specific DNA-methyltransferase [Runella rosea]